MSVMGVEKGLGSLGVAGKRVGGAADGAAFACLRIRVSVTPDGFEVVAPEVIDSLAGVPGAAPRALLNREVFLGPDGVGRGGSWGRLVRSTIESASTLGSSCGGSDFSAAA